MTDESTRLRDSYAGQSDDWSQSPHAPVPGAPAMCVRTAVKYTYPSTASSFYWCVPQTVLGTEVEGGAATLTAASSGIGVYALNLGTLVPPQGTPLVVTRVAYRWVFRFDG